MILRKCRKKRLCEGNDMKNDVKKFVKRFRQKNDELRYARARETGKGYNVYD